MDSYSRYRKFATMKNDLRIMFRLLNFHDRDGLVRMFQEAPEEDVRFLKQDVKDINLIQSWVDHVNYHKVLPLLAVHIDSNRLIGNATIHKGKHSAKHIGEVRIFVSRPFRNLGLGCLMLEELIGWAQRDGLQWLKAEVVAEQTVVIKAFRQKGFEAKATLDDWFIRKDGVTHDVVLMIRPVLKREESDF